MSNDSHEPCRARQSQPEFVLTQGCVSNLPQHISHHSGIHDDSRMHAHSTLLSRSQCHEESRLCDQVTDSRAGCIADTKVYTDNRL